VTFSIGMVLINESLIIVSYKTRSKMNFLKINNRENNDNYLTKKQNLSMIELMNIRGGDGVPDSGEDKTGILP
jgi:hypothetical protein